MLCPQCGNEVGEKIKLCDDCQAKRQARLAEERKVEEENNPPKATTPKSAAARATDPNAAEESSANNSSKRTRKRVAILVALLIFALVGVKIGKRLKHDKDVAPTSPQSTATAQSSSAAPTAEEFSYLGTVRGGLRYGKEEIRLAAVAGTYFRRTRRLELAFFRKWEKKIDAKAMRRKESLDTVQGETPDIVLSISFKPDLESCNLQGIEEYRLKIFRNDSTLGLPSPVTTFPVKQLGGTLGVGINTALETLACSFVDKEKINGNFRGSKQIVVRDESKSLSWELDFDLPLIGPADGKEVDYRSEAARTTIALWNSAAGTLDVGFFGMELSAEEKEQIRGAASLIALETKKPDAVFSLGLPQGASQLRREDIKTFGVTFYREGSESIQFPGFDKQVGLFYVGNSQGSGTLEGLSGTLKDGLPISGSYQHTIAKKVAAAEVMFSWMLAFQTVVLDTSVKGSPLIGAASPSTEKSQSETQAKINADNSQVRARSTVALYYVQSNSLSIGFYGDALNDEEVQEVLKRKTLTTYINRKRPAMVAVLEFDEGAKPSDPLALRAYTLYFYREVGGSLQFPGFHDVVSMKHTADQIPAGETVQVVGDPRTKAALQVILKGQGSPATLSTLFSWDILQEVHPLKID